MSPATAPSQLIMTPPDFESYLALAMQLCEDDYAAELNATVNFVEGKLAAERIGNSQYHGE